MNRFQGSVDCFCGKEFQWKYTKLQNGEIIVGKEDERLKNCLECTETANVYIFRLRCPHCDRVCYTEREK